MKYLLILGDGMSDLPFSGLNNKTPLEVANKPTIDMLAQKGTLGLVETVPKHLPPGSDVANLSVMGYDPVKYYSGRSPLEAASMGVPLEATDVTFRCNLVTLSEDEPYEEKIMLDYSSDEITTEEAKELISVINESFKSTELQYYKGISYRHLMVWKNGPEALCLTPPHDILDKKIADYLPKGANSEILLDMMKKSQALLKNHRVNLERIKNGLRPANAIWLWGQGKKPALPLFKELYGIDGCVVSAVDLVKGIGVCAGLEVVEVEGATGNIHTNFKGKADAALEQLKNGKDFAYVHIEAPDECGHRQETENKVKSIEFIDKEIVAHCLSELEKTGEPFSIMILPDHPTPLALRTHTHDPVPFIIYKNGDNNNNIHLSYTEENASKTGIFIKEGYTLMSKFLRNDI